MAYRQQLVELLKDLEDEISCDVCLMRVTNPKSLKCLHTFCEGCIKESMKRNGDVNCPKCRKVTSVPNAKTNKLPTTFFINQIQDVLQKHEKLLEEKNIRENHNPPKPLQNSPKVCPECEKSLVVLDAENCRKTVERRPIVGGNKRATKPFRNAAPQSSRRCAHVYKLENQKTNYDIGDIVRLDIRLICSKCNTKIDVIKDEMECRLIGKREGENNSQKFQVMAIKSEKVIFGCKAQEDGEFIVAVKVHGKEVDVGVVEICVSRSEGYKQWKVEVYSTKA